MTEYAYVDLLDASSRIVNLTSTDEPLWSGVLVLSPNERLRLADSGRHDFLVLRGSAAVSGGRVLERGDFAIRRGKPFIHAGSAGAQVLAYRDPFPASCEEATVMVADRPWRESRVSGMQIATLSTAGHALSLVLWQPGASTRHHAHPGGEEIFVLRGELCEDKRHPAGSWMRLHPGNWHNPHVETPTILLVRSGHLKEHRGSREGRVLARQ